MNNPLRYSDPSGHLFDSGGYDYDGEWANFDNPNIGFDDTVDGYGVKHSDYGTGHYGSSGSTTYGSQFSGGDTNVFGNVVPNGVGNVNFDGSILSMPESQKVAYASYYSGVLGGMAFTNGTISGAYEYMFDMSANEAIRRLITMQLEYEVRLLRDILIKKSEMTRGDIYLEKTNFEKILKYAYYMAISYEKVAALDVDIQNLQMLNTRFVAQFEGFDTLLYGVPALSGRILNIEGYGIGEVGHVNYAAVGTLHAHYGWAMEEAIPITVLVHNIDQARDEADPRGWGHMNDVIPGMYWAGIGAQYYRMSLE
jgi:hypothetical protein